ncbi:MAG: NUDIX domain-containing protein [Deltaproteobacteria bacterium]|nr:NUDIX domain-containing protein [Deltaproteobacteria bacterium]
MSEKRNYCVRCGEAIGSKKVDGINREYCSTCDIVFYYNPLPVVSSVVVNKNREVLLVLRDREPQRARWCLPSGFVEIDESIEEAVLRELHEETGLTGKVVRLLDTVSYRNEFYGDLIWITFEVQRIDGEVVAGDDARDARYWPITGSLDLAFPPNVKAIKRYRDYYQGLWKVQDSFKRLDKERKPDPSVPSDALSEIITRDAHILTENWIADVMQNPTTTSYARFDHDDIYPHAYKVFSQFGQWLLNPTEAMSTAWDYYLGVGRKRREEGFKLSEVLSALSLTRKHILTHVLARGGVWSRQYAMYSVMEFIWRVNLFFDKAAYNITLGYEEAGEK